MTKTTMTTMTTIARTMMTKRAKPRARQGGADKVWAVGLAGATCLGLVGAVGVRTAQEAAAEPVQSDEQMALTTGAAPQTIAVASSGLTEGQLDQYAQALENERLRLEAYHAELLDAAARLQAAADAQAGANEATAPASKPASKSASKPASKPKPVPKPVPKPAAAPQVAAPQAQTRGS
jgi:hypothetical protein